jgi:hypothetical protein
MVTSKDIEAARRLYVAARGTARENEAKTDLLVLIEQAKREHRMRSGGGVS